jgi:hypothetical protein
MRVYISAYAVLLVLLVYLGLSLVGVVPELAQREGNVRIEVALLVTALFGLLYALVILAAALWAAAPRRGWFWLVGTFPAIIFFGQDLPKILGLIRHPNLAALFGFLLVVGLVTLIITAAISFLNAHHAARRGKRPT